MLKCQDVRFAQNK